MMHSLNSDYRTLPHFLGFAALLCAAAPAAAQTAPSVGDAESFAVLAGSTVTAALACTIISGDVGVTPGLTITGFPGSAEIVPPYGTHANDAEAIAAQISATALYAELACIEDATALALELGGLTLSPGTYSCLTTAGIAAGGTLTLDGAGIYVFQIGTTLTAAAGANVVLVNGASADQVFWQVGTTATLSGEDFMGTIVAGTTITLAYGSDLDGRLLAPSGGGTVTMAGRNTINGDDISPINPSLGDAESFAVLAGVSVTAALICTVVNGDVGVSPGMTLAGFPTSAAVLPPYATHANDAEAMAARVSATTLFEDLACIRDATVLAYNLGGITLAPGTYSCLTTAGIAAGGTLTLDGAGFYVFQIGTTMTTAALSNVVLVNGASADQVFWQIGTTAAFSGETFYGTVVVGTTITLAAGADVHGRLLAPSAGGTVTLAGGNMIDLPTPHDATIGSNYCSSPVNSTGQGGQLSATGSAMAVENDLTLTVTQVPDGQFGYIVGSQTQGLTANPGGSLGNLCLAGNLARFNRTGEIALVFGGTSTWVMPLDNFPEHPTFGVSVVAGDTWNFQFWHRDMVDGTSVSNFSNGLEILFQ
jgi:hypothetical protein